MNKKIMMIKVQVVQIIAIHKKTTELSRLEFCVRYVRKHSVQTNLSNTPVSVNNHHLDFSLIIVPLVRANFKTPMTENSKYKVITTW